MARFRNGDVEAGLKITKRESEGGEFLPFMTFLLFERSVERFAMLHQPRREELMRTLDAAATSAKDIKAVLILLGYLAWPDMASLAWQIWKRKR
jgi:hypothetical protein